MNKLQSVHSCLSGYQNFNDREQAKKDFHMISDEFTIDLKKDDFKNEYNEYNKTAILKWYTNQSYIYRLINNSLRIALNDAILYCRFVITDLQAAIKEVYEEKSFKFSGKLYRGACLSEEEWIQLKTNTGKVIEWHGFMSTSKHRKEAMKFVKRGCNTLVTVYILEKQQKVTEGYAES